MEDRAVRSPGMRTRRWMPATAIVALLTLWFARGPSDCKQAAQPLIDALQRYRETRGCYPNALDALIRENRLRSVPRPTWNFGVLHTDAFQYWVDKDLDYFCLGYAEQQLLGTHWHGVFYVSFRGAWDDSPGVPKCDLFMLPLERVGDLFQKTRSSTDLRRLIRMISYKDKSNPWPVYWEDIARAVGKVVPCTTEGRPGFCVAAGGEEAAAFRFVTNPAPEAFVNKHEVILILERQREGTQVRWREVFRANERAPLNRR